MKKTITLILAFSLMLTLASCGATHSVQSDTSAESDKKIYAGATVDPNAETERDLSMGNSSPMRTEEVTEPVTGAPGIDVDLVVMSSTVVYAEVYLMVTEPEDYVGKTVRVRGVYTPVHDEESGMTYHYCVIKDATACCKQGLEFILTGEHTYPDDYPTEGVEIELSGVYSSYEENGEMYYYVSTDTIEIIQ